MRVLLTIESTDDGYVSVTTDYDGEDDEAVLMLVDCLLEFMDNLVELSATPERLN